MYKDMAKKKKKNTTNVIWPSPTDDLDACSTFSICAFPCRHIEMEFNDRAILLNSHNAN